MTMQSPKEFYASFFDITIWNTNHKGEEDRHKRMYSVSYQNWRIRSLFLLSFCEGLKEIYNTKLLFVAKV